MRKLYLFQNVSLDGYFEAPGHDLSWSHRDFEAFQDAESRQEGSRQAGTVLLGRRTYEMMKAFWPTPQAAATAPDVARYMNEARKVVASHEPFDPGWNNVTVISGDVVGEVRQLKEQPGGDIIMFGSNILVVSLMQAGLIDEFQLVVNPVALGKGTSLFEGLPEKVELKLKDTRRFKSGAIMLTYVPADR